MSALPKVRILSTAEIFAPMTPEENVEADRQEALHAAGLCWDPQLEAWIAHGPLGTVRVAIPQPPPPAPAVKVSA